MRRRRWLSGSRTGGKQRYVIRCQVQGRSWSRCLQGFNIACGLALRLLGCVFTTVFNAVVRLCIADLLPAFLRHLKVKVTSNVDSRKIEKATKGKLWTQIKPSVKSYLAAFTKVILHCILPRFTCKRFKMIISRYIFRWSV